MDFLAKLLGTPARKNTAENAGAASPAPVKQVPDPSPLKPNSQGPTVDITAPTPPRAGGDTAADPEFFVGFSRQLVEEVITSACEPTEDESADVSLSERYSLSNQSFDTASYGVTASLTDEPASAKNKTDTDSDGADFESADEQSTAAPPTTSLSTNQGTESLNESYGLTSVINKLSDFSLGSPAPQVPRDVNANPLYKCFSPSELDESRFSELSTQACCGSLASDSLNLTSNFTDEPSFSALNFLASACETIPKVVDQPEDSVLPVTPAKQVAATPPCTPAKSDDALVEAVGSTSPADTTSPESVTSDVAFITCVSDKTCPTEAVLSEQLDTEFAVHSETCDVSFVSTESSQPEITSEYSFSTTTAEITAVATPTYSEVNTRLQSDDFLDDLNNPNASFSEVPETHEGSVAASPEVKAEEVAVTAPDNLCEVSSTEQSPEHVQVSAFETPERGTCTVLSLISDTPQSIESAFSSLVLEPITDSPEIHQVATPQKLGSDESAEPVVTESPQVQSPESAAEAAETVQQDNTEASPVAEVQQESTQESPVKVEVQQPTTEESPEKVEVAETVDVVDFQQEFLEKVAEVQQESTEKSPETVTETVEVAEVQQEHTQNSPEKVTETVEVAEVQQESTEESAEVKIPESSVPVESVPELENFAEQVSDVSTTTPTDQVQTLQELTKQAVEAQDYRENTESLPTETVLEETKEVEDLAEPVSSEAESEPVVTESVPVEAESEPVATEAETAPVTAESDPVVTEPVAVSVETVPVAAETVAVQPVEQQKPSEPEPAVSEEVPVAEEIPAASENKVREEKEATPEVQTDDTDSFVVLEKPTEHAKEAPRLSELFDICQKQQQELSGDLSIEDLLAADAELICQEIHNASLRLSEDEDMAEPQEMKAPPRKSTTPRTHSSSPQRAVQQQAEAADPFRPRYKLSSSPTREGSSSLTSSGDSAVMSSRMQRESSAESGGSPKSLPSQDSGISGAEVNHSEAGPETAAAAEEQFVSSDIFFKDPNAFDFLLQMGGSAPAASRLERESLYVKFDPLVGSRERRVFLSPCLETSRGENTSVEESPAKQSQQQAEAAKDSPLPSSVGTLISIGTPTPVKQKQQAPDTPVSTKGGEAGGNTPTLREVNFAQELLERQAKAFEERLAREQAQAAEREEALKAQLEQSRASEAQQAVAKSNSEKQFGLVMKEYEDTISKMLAELEHKSKAWNIEKARLEAERKQAQDDLVGAELSFADLHRKYERAKEAIVGLKNNEEALRKSNADFQQSLEKSNTNYLKLKAHAEAQLEKANQEIDQLLSAKEVDQAAHDANVKRLKSQITSLEQSLAVQHREKQELMSICDDLLAKFGPNKA